MAASDINIHCISFAPFQWKFSILKTLVHRVWLFIGCKTKLKEIFLSWKNMFFTKYTFFIYMEKKSFILKIFFTGKKIFYREKYNWKCKNICISFEKYIFMQKVFVLQIKYKSFLNIYSSCNTFFFFIMKNVFIKTSLWTQQSGP